MEHFLTVKVPLQSEAQAKALYNTVRPDSELKPQEVQRTLKLENNYVIAEFEAITERTLRASVNSFMDVLGEATECLSEFDPAYYRSNHHE